MNFTWFVTFPNFWFTVTKCGLWFVIIRNILLPVEVGGREGKEMYDARFWWNLTQDQITEVTVSMYWHWINIKWNVRWPFGLIYYQGSKVKKRKQITEYFNGQKKSCQYIDLGQTSKIVYSDLFVHSIVKRPKIEKMLKFQISSNSKSNNVNVLPLDKC